MAERLLAHELIVVDGGSSDATASLVRHAKLVHSPPGRGIQMNAGAASAEGDVFLFLHVDTRLRPNALVALEESLADSTKKGGVFDVRFDGDDMVGRVFDWIYHYRRYVGIFYGDAGIFVRREEFLRLGGFRPYPIMEDYEFGRRLFGGWFSSGAAVAFLNEPIFVSDRRWRKAGLFRTLFAWVLIQTLFCLGFPGERLGRLYRQVR
jgi:glycosyltransferase involved in cell wall biosynthesis